MQLALLHNKDKHPLPTLRLHISLTISYCLALLCLPSWAQGQRCNTDHHMSEVFHSHPHLEQEIDKGFQAFYQKAHPRKTPEQIIIPVHVILVHQPGEAIGGSTNLSLAHVQSQIDVINQDFTRLNADAANTPPEFEVGSANISFELAEIDPDGQPTDGITRYASDLDFDDHEVAIKTATRWPRDTYLNIWVSPSVDDLGFAYIPSTFSLPNEVKDGCAVMTPAFGGFGYATFAPYNRGRTATHEIGHYLGLRHVWRNAGCQADDGIEDTPLQDEANFDCPSHPSPSCSNTGDMFMNFMDYVNDDCMNAFTVDQIAYMREILNTSRSSMLTAADRALSEDPPAVSISLVSKRDPRCFGDPTGRIQVNASGGNGSFTYRILGGPTVPNGVFADLLAGDYDVVALDGDGGADTINIILSDPPQLVWTDISGLQTTCSGEIASVVLSAEGGTGTLLYAVEDSAFQLSNELSLREGNWVCVVQDQNSCRADSMIVVSHSSTLGMALAITEISCAGLEDGSVIVEGSGGKGGYRYSLNNVNFFEINELYNFGPGPYTIYVQDEDCTVSESFSLIAPDSLVITDVQHRSGGIEVSAAGGRPPYRYRLNQGPWQAEALFQGQEAGEYSLAVQDSSGCETTMLVNITPTVDVEKDEPLVYPNPTTGRVVLDGVPADAWVEVLGIDGVLHSRTMAQRGAVDLPAEPGVYLLAIYIRGERFLTKVIRQ